MDVRCFHELPLAAPFAAAMDNLNLAQVRPDPFATFAFYRHLLDSNQRFATDTPARVWLLLVFDDEVLVGYVALQQAEHRVLGLRASRLGWLTAYRADRPHLIARADLATPVREAIYAHLLGRRREWSLLEFEQQAAASPSMMPPPQATRDGYRYRTWPNMPNATVNIRWNTLAAYVAALSSKARSNVTRQLRTLLAAGDVELLTSSDPQVLKPLFELYSSIEAHSWKAQAEAGFSGGRQWTEYYAGLMDAAQPMRIGIQVLLLDGVPIAGTINGVFCKGMYALHTVYDDRLSQLGPGSAIFLMGIRKAIDDGCEFLDLLWGFGYYKERWLAQISDSQSVQIVRVGTPYFWKQRVGDVVRRGLGVAADKAVAVFNPARRAVARAPAISPRDARASIASEVDHDLFAGLVHQVRQGQGEFLNAHQLAAAMPFETRRAQVQTAAHAVPRTTP